MLAGTISGSPDEAANYSVTVTAKDKMDSTKSISATYNFSVNAVTYNTKGFMQQLTIQTPRMELHLIQMDEIIRDIMKQATIVSGYDSSSTPPIYNPDYDVSPGA